MRSAREVREHRRDSNLGRDWCMNGVCVLQSSTLMAAALQGGYINGLPTLTSAAGGQLTSLSPPNGVTLSTVAPSSGKLIHLHAAVFDVVSVS